MGTVDLGDLEGIKFKRDGVYTNTKLLSYKAPEIYDCDSLIAVIFAQNYIYNEIFSSHYASMNACVQMGTTRELQLCPSCKL